MAGPELTPDATAPGVEMGDDGGGMVELCAIAALFV